MWKLIRTGLAYHQKAILITCLLAFIFTKTALVIAAIVGIVVLSTEDKERRLRLHMPLPVTRLQVGMTRVILPAMVVVLCTVPATVLSSAIVAGHGMARVIDAAQDMLFFAIMVIFFQQLLLAVGELQIWGGGRFLGALMSMAILVTLLALTLLFWIPLAQFGNYGVIAVGTMGMTLGLMRLTVHFFELRPNYATG